MKSDGCTTGKSQISKQILTHLVEHPHAKDTLEGIVEWWLLEQRIKRQTMKVKEALAELVANGLVLERKGRDSRSYYSINRRKTREIKTLLKQGPQ